MSEDLRPFGTVLIDTIKSIGGRHVYAIGAEIHLFLKDGEIYRVQASTRHLLEFDLATQDSRYPGAGAYLVSLPSQTEYQEFKRAFTSEAWEYIYKVHQCRNLEYLPKAMCTYALNNLVGIVAEHQVKKDEASDDASGFARNNESSSKEPSCNPAT